MSPFAEFEPAVRRQAPKAAIILGSGLGAVVEKMPWIGSVSFADVPGLAAPTVAGHSGKLLLAVWGGVPVLAFRGRMHFYEGHPWSRVVTTVNLAADLGVTTLLLTSAAGGIRDDLQPGDLMAIADHLPLLNPDAWRKVANESLEPSPYSRTLTATLKGLGLPTGVYAGLTGPTYETPAEIRALAAMGADAVGMSTVMEALAGQQRGLAVAAISCITNKAAGLSAAALDHGEVQELAGRVDVVKRMAKFVGQFLATIP